MLPILTVGAGGGSIAKLDQGGMLKVGPQSAGALPPAATSPTWKEMGPRLRCPRLPRSDHINFDGAIRVILKMPSQPSQLCCGTDRY